MEDLNKNQIVLLALLVSFVTSIATGIMTVSLLQEAPVEVTRNINRVVEKTIEKVVPETVTANLPSQKEVTTVIVKEEDSVIDAVAKNAKSIVRIKERDPLAGVTTFYGIGLVIDKTGIVAADRKEIIGSNAYTAVLPDGSEVNLDPTGIDKKTNFILFQIVPDKNHSSFIPTTFADAEPKLGQTLVSLGGDTTNAISVGRVTTLVMKDTQVGTTTTKYLGLIDTDISSKDIVDGDIVFNLSGDIVGIKLDNDQVRSFTPISLLKKELSSLLDIQKTQ